MPLVRPVPAMLLLPSLHSGQNHLLKMLLCICSCSRISMALQPMASSSSPQIDSNCMVWQCRLPRPRQMEGSPDRRITSQIKQSGTELVGKKCQIW